MRLVLFTDEKLKYKDHIFKKSVVACMIVFDRKNIKKIIWNLLKNKDRNEIC